MRGHAIVAQLVRADWLFAFRASPAGFVQRQIIIDRHFDPAFAGLDFTGHASRHQDFFARFFSRAFFCFFSAFTNACFGALSNIVTALSKRSQSVLPGTSGAGGSGLIWSHHTANQNLM